MIGMKIKIIRHAERLDYTKPLSWMVCFGHYWYDTPLTSQGHSQALIKGRDLNDSGFKPKYVITSPYLRTLETSTELNKSLNATIVIEPLLSEYQNGYCHRISLYPQGLPTTFQGKTTVFKYPELYSSFKERVVFVINNIICKYSDDILIVTHGELIKVYIGYLQEIFPYSDFDVTNIGYLSTLTFEYQNGTIDPMTIVID